jgi:N-acetylneuraminic acid mutarotase
VLGELWSALGNDPRLIAEIVARPIVAERELRAWFSASGRSGSFDAWWRSVRPGLSSIIDEPAARYLLPSMTADTAASGDWSPTHALPEGNIGMSGVWTGSELIVWGGTDALRGIFNSGSRYSPATDTWQPTSGVGAPYPRKQHSAVWTGTEMIIWGGCGLGNEHSCQINSGGRYDPMTDTWEPTSLMNAPQARLQHTAVWTGSKMIVWGGCRFVNDACNAASLGNSGGRYDPASDTWTPTSTAGAPSARVGHTAVWMGTSMVVWGGFPLTATGGRYDLASDTWTPTSMKHAPAPRYSHTAVRAGKRMIVWGGGNGANDFSDGATYNAGTDKWTAIAPTGAPSARERHSAVWTGTEMIVWGGCTNLPICNQFLNTGGRYNPSTDSWSATASAGAPGARADHVAVWTGSLMVVWGGVGPQSTRLGARYDPASDGWTPTDANEATSAREWPSSVWTGTEMIVWGGDDRGTGTTMTGGRYAPATDSWQPTSTVGAPGPRNFHTAVWTGTQMIVWGGQYGSQIFKTGGRYNPMTDTWSDTSTAGAPVARSQHTAVWTGTRMVVWGGGGEQSFMKTGGVYDPKKDKWTATATAGAPEGRQLHTAVWTGSRMLVWGGQAATGYPMTGGSYDPATNAWTPISTAGAPEGRYSHAAVWTGSQMVVWGGGRYEGSFTLIQTGGRYDPATDTWSPTATAGAPTGRLFFGSVWTGQALVVWGGCTVDSACTASTSTGGEYDPAADAWAPTTLSGSPSARGKLATVWTGSDMVVWGGVTDDSGTYTNIGAGYRPLTG